MAGYLMTFDSYDSLVESANKGIYSTKLSIPKNRLWYSTSEATYSDFASMKEGDNVYLFRDRKIYGIGELINIDGQCKFLNFPQANEPRRFEYKEIKNYILLNQDKWGEEGKELRWICTFRAAPHFFKQGVDMDTVLSSNPSAFKMLRAFQKLSFIKVDDSENQALKDILLKRNENFIKNPAHTKILPNKVDYHHNKIRRKIEKSNYCFEANQFYLNSALKTGLFRRESTLELAVLHQISAKEFETLNIFESWDYLSHQVVASPFKPIQWMDKMDVFGYRYIENHYPTISKYMVAELKKDSASIENVNQLLKYVDWINNEYSFGDYSMIKAFLVASDFSTEVIDHVKNAGSRKYTRGLRDEAVSEEWKDITLVKYHYNTKKEKVKFEVFDI